MSNGTEAELKLKIVNEKGLHARASAKFVEVVEAHDASAEVCRDGMSVSGDSIMGLLMLAASRGSTTFAQAGQKPGNLPMRWMLWLPTALGKITEPA